MTSFDGFKQEIARIRTTLGRDLGDPRGVVNQFLTLLEPDGERWSERRFGNHLAEVGGLLWNLCFLATPSNQRAELAEIAIGLMKAGLKLSPGYDLILEKLGVASCQSLRFDEACEAFNAVMGIYEREGKELSPYDKTYAAVAFIRTGEVARGRRLAIEALQSDQLEENEKLLANAMLKQTSMA